IEGSNSAGIPANLSNESQSNTCRYDENDWIFTVIPVYILIISVLGIILNVFVLMVFWLHKKACTVAEIYLSNLAAADLFLVSMLPFWAVSLSERLNWPFGGPLCKLVPFSISMNGYCSIYILVLVSIDRYLTLVHPLTHERMRSPFCAKLACVVVWAVCFLLNVPNVSRLVSILNVILNFVIPILIISFCTLKIIQALRNRLRESFSTQGKKHKATTLILAVLLAFLICWVPFHVFKILDLLSRYNIVGGCEFRLGWFQQIFIFLAFFNSVLNPILYVCVGRNFRRKAKETFTALNIELTRIKEELQFSRSPQWIDFVDLTDSCSNVNNGQFT
uniref:Bradykinin receptor B2 n=1 Tax=Amphiprion percula TaxID=161767 RepID=A0A3P8TD94_AMPPE